MSNSSSLNPCVPVSSNAIAAGSSDSTREGMEETAKDSADITAFYRSGELSREGSVGTMTGRSVFIHCGAEGSLLWLCGLFSLCAALGVHLSKLGVCDQQLIGPLGCCVVLGSSGLLLGRRIMYSMM